MTEDLQTDGTEVDPGAPSHWDGPRCNAKRQRGKRGFCKQPAGWGTDHLGEGRCYMHGGRPERAHEAAPYLSDAIKELSVSDAEALMSMGTTAMILARARLMERLLLPGITTKEAADLTISLTRLEQMIAKHPDLDDPDAAPNTGKGQGLDEELQRLIALERKG